MTPPKDPKIDAGSLFQFGYYLDRSGLPKIADTVYQSAIGQLEESFSCDYSSLAGSAHQHGLNLFRLGRPHEARVAFAEAVRRYKTSIEMSVSARCILSLAQAEHWLARCHHLTGQIEQAAALYEQSIALYGQLMSFGVPSQKLRRSHQRLVRLLSIARREMASEAVN